MTAGTTLGEGIENKRTPGGTTRRKALSKLLGLSAGAVALGCLPRSNFVGGKNIRKVIVTSDDAGMCRAVNLGTIQAMQHGVVSSASIMTCCPAFDEFAKFAVAHPEFDYGVHLVLTCDLREQPWGPVVAVNDVPTLVDQDGLFPMRPTDDIKIDEAARELRAQIKRALDAGIRISHLDHHMWVLFLSRPLMELYTQLGIEFRLPVRISRSIPRQLQARNQPISTAYLAQVKILESHGFPILEFIESDNYSVAPADKREYFLKQLRSLPPGVSEIAVHCSVIESTANPPDVERRRADLAFFTSLEVEEELRKSRLQRVDWREIAS